MCEIGSASYLFIILIYLLIKNTFHLIFKYLPFSVKLLKNTILRIIYQLYKYMLIEYKINILKNVWLQ